MKKRIDSFVWFALAGLCVLLAETVLAAEKVVEVPTEKLVAASRNLFSGLDLKIDNYGGKKKSQWYRQQSYMTLPNGETIHFDVPRFHLLFGTPVGRRYWHYFINELALDRTRVVPEKGGIKLIMEFESTGNEIKGKCTRRTFDGKDNCEYRGTRDIQFDNARAIVHLRPAQVKGRLGFAPLRPQDVSLTADIKVPKGLCRTINAMQWVSYAMGAFAENLAGQHFANQCQKVRKVLSDSVVDLVTNRLRQALNRPQVRDHMASFITRELKLPVGKNWHVASVNDVGSRYRIVMRTAQGKSPTGGQSKKPPRAPIPASPAAPAPKPRAPVSIVEFKARPKVLIGQCPGVVRFSGQVRSMRPGTVRYYFENDKGVRSGVYALKFDQPGVQPVIPWSIPVDRPKGGMKLARQPGASGQDRPRYEVQGRQKLVLLTPVGPVTREAEYKVDCDKPKTLSIQRMPD